MAKSAISRTRGPRDSPSAIRPVSTEQALTDKTSGKKRAASEMQPPKSNVRVRFQTSQENNKNRPVITQSLDVAAQID